MKTESETAPGTPEDIAGHLRAVRMLATAINGWANEYARQLPRGSTVTLNQYRSLLTGELLALQNSLERYDPAMAEALEKSETA